MQAEKEQLKAEEEDEPERESQKSEAMDLDSNAESEPEWKKLYRPDLAARSSKEIYGDEVNGHIF